MATKMRGFFAFAFTVWSVAVAVCLCVPNQRQEVIAEMKVAYLAASIVLSGMTAVSLVQPPAAKAQDALPPKLAALVPQGMKLLYQRLNAAPSIAVAEFSVEKSLPEGHTLTYVFAMNAYDSKSPTWAMREPIYKQDQEKKVAKAMQGAPPAYTEADAPIMTKYGWGSGVSRRLVHHPPQSKEYVDFQCVYFGMIGGITFDLHVSGMQGGCSAADQWAGSVAAVAAKSSVANLGL